MANSNTVSGADRTPAFDPARRPANRRGEGGEEFSTALSAETEASDRLRATADRSQSQRTDSQRAAIQAA